MPALGCSALLLDCEQPVPKIATKENMAKFKLCFFIFRRYLQFSTEGKIGSNVIPIIPDNRLLFVWFKIKRLFLAKQPFNNIDIQNLQSKVFHHLVDFGIGLLVGLIVAIA